MLPIIVNAQVPAGSPNGYKNLHVYIPLREDNKVAQAQKWLQKFFWMQDVCEIMSYNGTPVMHFKPVYLCGMYEWHGVYQWGFNDTTNIAFFYRKESEDARWGFANLLDDNFAQEERMTYYSAYLSSNAFETYDFAMHYEGRCALMLNPKKFPVHYTENPLELLEEFFNPPNKVAAHDNPDEEDAADLGGADGFDDVDHLS